MKTFLLATSNMQLLPNREKKKNHSLERFLGKVRARKNLYSKLFNTQHFSNCIKNIVKVGDNNNSQN